MKPMPVWKVIAMLAMKDSQQLIEEKTVEEMVDSRAIKLSWEEQVSRGGDIVTSEKFWEPYVIVGTAEEVFAAAANMLCAESVIKNFRLETVGPLPADRKIKAMS